MRFSGCIPVLLLFVLCSCLPKKIMAPAATSSAYTFMTLDPGHFHAGLVHKTMYAGVDSVAYIFAPKGQEFQDHLARIEGYNSREISPTSWKLQVYTGDDFLDQMLEKKPGNVVVLAGKNNQKIDYILSSLQQGIHVYADKPLVIDAIGFEKLKRAYQLASEKKLLMLDMMTERFEIATILQRELSMMPQVFGELETGSPTNPSITKESVHHFYKQVSGVPLVRPTWFFDVEKEGTGIVDVTTHLVDLIQWEAYPNQILDTTEVQVYASKIWPTALTQKQFQQVTQREVIPVDMEKYVQDDMLQVMSNGEFQYTLRGKHAKVSVIWNFQAPEGAGDTHYSLMRGTKASLIIRQGKEEGYKPVLYVKLQESHAQELVNAIKINLQPIYPGIDLQKLPSGEFKIVIPDYYYNGHEAHFAQVTDRYVDFLRQGQVPEWEVPNTITKYYTTTKALELALK
ncbi:MAG: hypothetical protein RL407_370 [Bacteroidota bacterium]|jgi:predicted dehydrogenase